MEFQEVELDYFLALFESIKLKVNDTEGCTGMKLLYSEEQPNVVFTYSIWENVEALNAYRNSPFFKDMWADIKPRFSKPAKAWSLKAHFNGFELK